MAKVKCKDLYIAKSMSELNEKCSYEFDKNKGIKAHLTLVNRTYQCAESAFTDHDEERAYILFMRYLDATTKVRKSKEFKKQADHYSTLFGNAKSVVAIEKAEKLSESLKKRYKKHEETKPKVQEETEKNGPVSTNGCKEVKEEYSFPTESVTSQGLYQILYKDKKDVVVMDIRSVDDYENSHFIHPSSINVPSNAITPGSVTAKIEKGIPLTFIQLWNARDTVDIVVLVDWHSSVKRLQDKSDALCSLKDSIYKWEQDKELKRSPVVLEGGYSEWLESFPQFTSNPRVTPPDNKPKTSKINSMLDFNYSELRQNFQSPDNEVVEDNFYDKPDVKKVNESPESPNDVASSHFNINETKVLPREPPSSTSNNSIPSGLYPKIDKTFSAPKVTPPVASTPPLQEEKVNISNNFPTFDRSTKPKVVAPVVAPSQPTNEPSSPSFSQPVPAKIDRSTKPTGVVGKSSKLIEIEVPPSNNGQNEVDELDQKILRMKKEKEDNERRVHEIEKKKREAELKKLEQEAQQLKEREMQAEKDLAATMRNISKPPNVNAVDKSKNVVDNAQNSKLSAVSEQISPKKVNSVVPSAHGIEKRDQQESEELKASPKKPTVANVADFKELEVDSSSTTSTSPKHATNHLAPVLSTHGINEKPDSNKELKNTIVSNNLSSTTAKNSVLKPTTLQPENVVKPVTYGVPPENVVKPVTYGVPPENVVKPVSPGVPPPTYASVKKTRVGDTNIVLTEKKAQKHTTPTSSNIYHAPLKDESEKQSFSLKRSFSSPNIAKMVQEEIKQPQMPDIPSRLNKPEAPNPRKLVEIPNREVKPKYQEESDQTSSQLNLSLRGVYGGGERGICGLRNLGNSCYMNSVLQCMFNTTQLAEYILTNSYRKDINKKNILGHGGRVAECFAVLLRAVWSGQYKYLIPSDMKQIAGSINPLFCGYSQEDSHELLLMLLDGMHEDLNRIVKFKYEEEPDNDHLSDSDAAMEAWKYYKKRNESIIVELFTGQFKATVRCLSCGKTSRKFDAFRFLTLSLPSKSASIYDLVRDFSKTEKMTGSDKWKCPNCNVLREAERTIAIWKLPPILIVHLKRFVHTGRWRDKIHTNINFPTINLDLQKYTRGQHKPRIYNLFAVSHHHGAGLDSGHYTASCKSVVDRKWYKFDDTEAYPISSPHDSTAFILFYSAYPRQVPRHAPL